MKKFICRFFEFSLAPCDISDWLAAVITSVSVFRHSNLSLPYERDGDHFLADRLVHQGTPKFKCRLLRKKICY